MEVFSKSPNLYAKSLCPDHKNNNIALVCEICYKMACHQCSSTKSDCNGEFIWVKPVAQMYNALNTLHEESFCWNLNFAILLMTNLLNFTFSSYFFMIFPNLSMKAYISETRNLKFTYIYSVNLNI